MVQTTNMVLLSKLALIMKMGACSGAIRFEDMLHMLIDLKDEDRDGSDASGWQSRLSIPKLVAERLVDGLVKHEGAMSNHIQLHLVCR